MSTKNTHVHVKSTSKYAWEHTNNIFCGHTNNVFENLNAYRNISYLYTKITICMKKGTSKYTVCSSICSLRSHFNIFTHTLLAELGRRSKLMQPVLIWGFGALTFMSLDARLFLCKFWTTSVTHSILFPFFSIPLPFSVQS